MKFRNAPRNCRLLLVLPLALGGLSSCGKRKESASPAAVVAPALRENRVGELPGPVHQSQAGSAIPWQPWSKDAFHLAGEARRLVLAVVVMPQLQNYPRILSVLEKDPRVVESIRDSYVPVLVDGDSVREMGLLADPLSREIKRTIGMPFLIWMTSDGNPVAWIALPDSENEMIIQTFTQSDGMVRRMWKDDPEYMMKNSAMDTASRRKRFLEAESKTSPVENPAAESINGARQLLSLYDPVSRAMDETGGLIPLGPLDVAVASALLPGLPQPIRERSRENTVHLLEDLLGSAMFDPLEGGVFPGSVGKSWALPVFGWNCQDQAKVAISLFRAHRLTSNPIALERALDLLRFAEKRFQVDGAFSFGAAVNDSPKNWMWTIEEVRKILPAEDADWWIAATGMAELGNLPSEIDVNRQFFRWNTLSLPRPLVETATSLAVDAPEFETRFQKSRATLTEVRNQRLKPQNVDGTPNASSTFRMISAYAAAYTATGDVAYRTKAVNLLENARNLFFKDKVLNAVAAPGNEEVTPARAFVYALAIQASQDVADVTLDAAPLSWAEELAGIASSSFIHEKMLMEASPSDSVLDLPIVDRHRLFDDTSGGLFALAHTRSVGQGEAFRKSLAALSMPFPATASRLPVLFTDSILAALVEHHSVSIIYGHNLSPEMAETLSKLPTQWVPRAAAKESDGVPEGSIKIISPSMDGKLIANPSELLKEMQLSDKNP